MLHARLNDSRASVRAAAALSTGRMGRSIPELRLKLESMVLDPNERVGRSALLALGMLAQKRSVLHLRSILSNKRNTPPLRAAAAMGLGFMRDPANLPLLDTIAKSERKNLVRAAAVIALGLIGEKRAAKSLLAIAMGRGDPSIRSLAVSSLNALAVRTIPQQKGAALDLVRILEHSLLTRRTPAPVRQAIVLYLERHGDERTYAVLWKIAETDPDRIVRCLALVALARMKKSDANRASLKGLLRGILRNRKEPHTVHAFAALSLGLTKDQEAAPLLRKLFNSHATTGELRSAAAVGLGLLEYANALPLLGREIEMPKSGGDTRAYACMALGLIGDPNASKYLSAVAGHVNVPYLQYWACCALGELQATSSIPILAPTATHAHAIVRVGAYRGLSRLARSESIEVLLRCLPVEPNEDLCALLVHLLGRAGATKPSSFAAFKRLAAPSVLQKNGFLDNILSLPLWAH